MTLWNQRLIKFVGKIFGVIMIIIVITFFLFYYYFFKKDNLIKYVPQDAALYVTFKLDANFVSDPLLAKLLVKFKQDFNLSEIDLQSLNQLVNYNGALAIVPIITEGQISFDYLLLFDLKTNSQDAGDYFVQHNWSSKQIQINALGKKILVASNSPSLVDRVIKIASQQEPSLVQNINVVYNLRQFNHDFWAKAYLNIAQLAKVISKTDNLDLKLFLASLVVEDNNQLYLGLRTTGQQMIIESPDFKAGKKKSMAINNLSDNFLLELDLDVSSNKLVEFYKLVEIIDKAAFSRLKANQQFFEDVNQIRIEADILPILARSSQFVLDQQKDWFLAMSLAYESNQSQFLAKVEEIIIKYLAVNYPLEVKKKLPDQTTITQIVKNNQIEFIDDKIANFSLKTIKVANYEFSYYASDDWFILANNKEKLIEYLSKNQIANNDTIQDNFEGKDNVIVNTQYLQQYSAYFSLFKYLIINDNLNINEGIRLILE